MCQREVVAVGYRTVVLHDHVVDDRCTWIGGIVHPRRAGIGGDKAIAFGAYNCVLKINGRGKDRTGEGRCRCIGNTRGIGGSGYGGVEVGSSRWGHICWQCCDQGDLGAVTRSKRTDGTDDRCHTICTHKAEGCARGVVDVADIKRQAVGLVRPVGQHELMLHCATLGRIASFGHDIVVCRIIICCRSRRWIRCTCTVDGCISDRDRELVVHDDRSCVRGGESNVVDCLCGDVFNDTRISSVEDHSLERHATGAAGTDVRDVEVDALAVVVKGDCLARAIGRIDRRRPVGVIQNTRGVRPPCRTGHIGQATVQNIIDGIVVRSSQTGAGICQLDAHGIAGIDDVGVTAGRCISDHGFDQFDNRVVRDG